jgi:hypothetical protein
VERPDHEHQRDECRDHTELVDAEHPAGEAA